MTTITPAALTDARAEFTRNRKPQHQADYAEAAFLCDKAAELAELVARFGADANEILAAVARHQMAVTEPALGQYVADHVADCIETQLASVFRAALKGA